nr:DUF4194 domain-containing protein [Nonlabens ulvanivorans]
MIETNNGIKNYSKAVITLLKGIVESTNKVIWDDILSFEDDIRPYVKIMGLELVIKREDGYAYLKQADLDGEGETIGLVSKRRLSFSASVILVILRQMLYDFEKDIDSYDTLEKFVSEEELKSEIEDFLPKGYDLVGFYKNLENNITRIKELGFIKKKTTDDGETVYIIHKIIKEKVNIDTLLQFKKNLENYGV